MKRQIFIEKENKHEQIYDLKIWDSCIGANFDVC